MKSGHLRLLLVSILLLPVMVSCRKVEKVVVTEQRVLTMYDGARDSLVVEMPPEWRQIPGTQFRIFNYRFGEDGEVFVGRSQGDVLQNANRWLAQFGKPAVSNVHDFPKVDILGNRGVLVSASGEFGGAMGRPPRENAGLLGVIIGVGNQILTVKMMGDADAVAAERQRLLEFCKNMRIRETKPSK